MPKRANTSKSTALAEKNAQSLIDSNIEHVSISIEGEIDFPLSIPASPQTIKNVSEWERKKKADTQSRLVLMFGAFWGVSLLTCLLFVGIGTLTPSADKELIKDMSLKILGAETVLYGAVLKSYFDKKPKDK
jgi:hypothetical protein